MNFVEKFLYQDLVEFFSFSSNETCWLVSYQLIALCEGKALFKLQFYEFDLLRVH